MISNCPFLDLNLIPGASLKESVSAEVCSEDRISVLLMSKSVVSLFRTQQRSFISDRRPGWQPRKWDQDCHSLAFLSARPSSPPP
jgi:hypothetical protein